MAARDFLGSTSIASGLANLNGSSSARSEAATFWHFLQNQPTESVDSIRKLIRGDDTCKTRRLLLAHFDAILTAKNCAEPSPELKQEIMRRIALGQKPRRVASEFGLALEIVMYVASVEPIPANVEPDDSACGCGCAAGDVASRAASVKPCSPHTKTHRTLEAEELQRAEAMLRGGVQWRDVAKQFNTSVSTLMNNMEYRKVRK